MRCRLLRHTGVSQDFYTDSKQNGALSCCEWLLARSQSAMNCQVLLTVFLSAQLRLHYLKMKVFSYTMASIWYITKFNNNNNFFNITIQQKIFYIWYVVNNKYYMVLESLRCLAMKGSYNKTSYKSREEFHLISRWRTIDSGRLVPQRLISMGSTSKLIPQINLTIYQHYMTNLYLLTRTIGNSKLSNKQKMQSFLS